MDCLKVFLLLAEEFSVENSKPRKSGYVWLQDDWNAKKKATTDDSFDAFQYKREMSYFMRDYKYGFICA